MISALAPASVTTTSRSASTFMRSLRLLAITAVLLLSASAAAHAATTDFAIESSSASLSSYRAGGHPDLTTKFSLALDPDHPACPYGCNSPPQTLIPYAQLKDAKV